jgi:hypothetical protein
MTLSGNHKKLTQKPLLPESDKTISDVLPSPDGNEMAFVSDGVLYTVPLAGSVEPHPSWRREQRLTARLDQLNRALHNVGCSWGPKCAGAPVRNRRRLDAGGGAWCRMGRRQ